MTKEYTPGPWMLDPDDPTKIVSSGGVEIASVFTDPDESELNAILIRAVPELLTVCELALSLARTDLWVDPIILEHAIDNARGKLK